MLDFQPYFIMFHHEGTSESDMTGAEWNKSTLGLFLTMLIYIYTRREYT